MKSCPTKPFSFQALATVSTLVISFSPLWLQLSIETTASGAAPAAKRSSSSAATMLIAWRAWAGPSFMSASTTGIRLPSGRYSA